MLLILIFNSTDKLIKLSPKPGPVPPSLLPAVCPTFYHDQASLLLVPTTAVLPSQGLLYTNSLFSTVFFNSPTLPVSLMGKAATFKLSYDPQPGQHLCRYISHPHSQPVLNSALCDLSHQSWPSLPLGMTTLTLYVMPILKD